MRNRWSYSFSATCVLLWFCMLARVLLEDESTCDSIKQSAFLFLMEGNEGVELGRIGANGECAVAKWEKKLVILCGVTQKPDLDYSTKEKFKLVTLSGGQTSLLLTEEGKLGMVEISKKSENLSVEFNWIDFDLTVMSIEPHPTRGDSVLALARKPSASKNELYYSCDFGKNWKKILDDVDKVFWARPEALDKTSDRISFYYIMGYGENGGELYSAVFEVVDSPDMYQNLKTVKWPESDHVLDVKIGDDGTLFVILNRDGRRVMGRSFQNFSKYDEILFPDRVKNIGSLSMLENGPVIYLGMTENAQDDRATLYVFNPDRGSFSTNLKNMVARNTKTGKITMDVAHIEGLDGVMLANVWVDAKNLDEVQVSENENGQKKIETRITFHAGSYWHHLNAPIEDCLSEEPCRLNLVGAASGNKDMSPKSTDVISGLILAIGSTPVTSESTHETRLNTYMSIDAGKNWKKITTGSSLFDFTTTKTHILIVPNETSNQFIYSSTYGESWISCNFSFHKITGSKNSKSVQFHSILPFSKFKFLVVGSASTFPDKFDWYLFVLDFDPNNLLKSCNLNTGDFDLSDYDDSWIPSDFTGSGCIAGKKAVYVRRKFTSQCIPDPIITSIAFNRINCSCTPLDYLCDYCYTPVVGSDGYRFCFLECPKYDPSSPPSNCVGSWIQSTGYTLIPGDVCIGGDQLQGPQKACPAIIGSHSLSKAIYVILSILFLLLVFTLGFLLWHSAAHSTPIRNVLSKFIPDRFLPRKITDNESWGLYHPLDNPNNTAINENDIFNDDEFLKEDPNILDLEDEYPTHLSS